MVYLLAGHVKGAKREKKKSQRKEGTASPIPIEVYVYIYIYMMIHSQLASTGLPVNLTIHKPL